MKIRSHSLLLWILVSALSLQADLTIHDAAREGDLAVVKRLLRAEPQQLDALDRFQYTPLDWAATRARWDVVRWLVEAGAAVGNVGWDGGTVLHRACHYDAPQIVRLLLQKGADPDHRNQWGRSALHVAARRDCREVAAVLVSVGADLQAATREGWTPLHVAALSGHAGMMEFLYSSGADRTQKDGEGRTPRECFKPRPREKARAAGGYGPYLGSYLGEDGFRVEIWEDRGRIHITDFGFDEMYPIGEDEFYCRHEPWRVQFFRDEENRVVEMELGFLRRSHRLKKDG
jgi:ankyrin repeat protein